MRNLDVSSSNNALRRFGLACVRFDHVQLRHNVALKFDATFSVLVFPLDVSERFARLIAHALREVPH